ncbi:MAG: hypothetical protein HZB41_03340, partial [Ignavibacteriae bacterium]|nr:hypothetical protein [Ignavibacteriota bacterium]
EWEKIDSSKGLFDRNVLALAPDNFGNIWIGSTHGIYFYNGNYFTKYDSSNSGLQDNVIYSLLLDQNQNLWIATGDSGLIKFDGSTFTKFYRSEWKYYDSHELRKLALDSNGNIWMIVGSNNGVAVLHPDLVSVEDNKLKNDINIYPNPFFNVINIDYQNLSQNNLNIELLDLLSNKVYSKDFGIMDIGLHNLKITIDNPISQGSYYLLINSNNKLIFKELIHLE